VYFNPKRLRRPGERVGTLSNAALPPPSGNSITDADDLLVRSLRARDERAFDKLINRYYHLLLRLAIGFVRSWDEADEVIQETWLAVLAGIDRFEGRSSFKTWLFHILMNRARTRAQREARTLPFSAFAARDSASADPEDASARFDVAPPVWAAAPSRSRTPEDDLLATELRVQIDAAIAELPRNQQDVLTLRDIEGWSAREVCNALELSETNQRVLLHRARVKVRDALIPYINAGVRDADSRLSYI
jgi:RNA polymerase sigma-70 factor (ECF subfamily)